MSKSKPEEKKKSVSWLGLAELRHGMTACVLVESTLTEVLSYRLLAVGQEPDAAEDAWQDASYHLVFRQEPLPEAFEAKALLETKPFGPEDVVGAWGYALERERPRSGNWGVVALRTDGNTVVGKQLASLTPDWLTGWAEYEGLALRNLIRKDRRKA